MNMFNKIRGGGYMIRLCEEKDRGQLLNYLQENPIYHTFLLADMEQYGFNHSFQQIYVQEENGECQGVYLRYYHNLILAGEPDYIDGRAVAQLVNGEIRTHNGKRGTCQTSFRLFG